MWLRNKGRNAGAAGPRLLEGEGTGGGGSPPPPPDPPPESERSGPIEPEPSRTQSDETRFIIWIVVPALTLMCCFPIAIPALIFGILGFVDYRNGAMEQAEQKLDWAKKLSIAAIAVGVAFGLLWVCGNVVGFALFGG